MKRKREQCLLLVTFFLSLFFEKGKFCRAGSPGSEFHGDFSAQGSEQFQYANAHQLPEAYLKISQSPIMVLLLGFQSPDHNTFI